MDHVYKKTNVVNCKKVSHNAKVRERVIYAALSLHMQIDCFQIQTYDQPISNVQLSHCAGLGLMHI